MLFIWLISHHSIIGRTLWKVWMPRWELPLSLSREWADSPRPPDTLAYVGGWRCSLDKMLKVLQEMTCTTKYKPQGLRIKVCGAV